MLRRPLVIRRLDSYVRGEQSDAARRETAHLLDASDEAYNAYIRTRGQENDMQARLAPHGTPDRLQLDRAFSNIGAALNGSTPLYRLPMLLADWRLSVVIMCMAALLFAPGIIDGNRAIAMSIATQPQPRAISEENVTPTSATAEESLTSLMTPQLATASFIVRATPTAPDLH